MGGIIRYNLTFTLEMAGVGLRYWAIVWAGSPFLSDSAVHTLAIIGAVGPPCYSLLAWVGPPGGNWIMRWKVRGRAPTITEQAILAKAFRTLTNRGITPPRFVYTVDQPDLNASVIGHTLYLHRDLYASPHLIAVLAHEMGHYHSNDGRLALALHRLTIPGGWLVVAFTMRLIGLIGSLLNPIERLLSAISYIVLRIEITIPTRLNQFIQRIVVWMVIALVGGIGIVATVPLWRSYIRRRELAADRYAAQHGFACALTLFLRQSQLDEMNLPWNQASFHPPVEERLAALQPYLPHLSDDGVEYAIS
ncbi:M48 family metalloprotease [Chloroflexus sp.]|uniref:M48 family metalloprotease n=1 Tax=Chloroflexus sp. TaxID=1904827 RepID=UPI002ACEE274|nr:M48 family metalloprotease [Chloroflexus sp.]